MNKKFVLLCHFYTTAEDTKTATKDTVHFIAGNINLQLLEFPKVSGKANSSPISFFCNCHLYVHLSAMWVCAAHTWSCLCLKPYLLFFPILARSFDKLNILQMYSDRGHMITLLWCFQVLWLSTWTWPSWVQSQVRNPLNSWHANFPQLNSFGWDKQTTDIWKTKQNKKIRKAGSYPNAKHPISNILPKFNLIPAQRLAVVWQT